MSHAPRPHAWLHRLRLLRAARRAARAQARGLPHEGFAQVIDPTPAAVLAREHDHLTQATPFDLSRALAAHDRALAHTYAVARTAATDNRRIEPAAEWLIDNVYLIRNQIREVRESLSTKVWLRLPRCRTRDGTVVPRVLRVVHACIAGLDGSVEPAAIERYLETYQREATLELVELWMLPILIRVALIEGLAAGAAAIARRLQAYSNAEFWAAHLIEVAAQKRGDMLVSVADMARTHPFESPAFAAEFHRLLEGKHPALKLALTFAEQQLEQRGTSVGRVIDEESRGQAADLVSIANRINSLRQVGETNWSGLVERVSKVDRILAEDPAGAYTTMDFTTRGRYRHAIELLAKRGDHPETVVAQHALDLARRELAPDTDPRVRHVGHYLIGAGRPELARELGVASPVEHRLAARLRRWPATTYLGSVFLVTAAITLAAAIGGWPPDSLVLDAGLLVALFVAASQPAVALVNWLLGMLVRAQLLPRMSFSGGIPDACRTLVVVPWLLGNAEGLAEQLDALEIRYLGNRDANLRYALLTDFPDAAEREMPGDAALLEAATAGIDRLNAKYPLPGSTRFLLFHRPREWNVRQSAWMGFERKRGKLGDLNRVLRGARPERLFSVIVGDLQALQRVRYVITLDADTQLPPDAARKLVETMAHPLNRPWFNKGSRRVVAGYGLLQPRISVTHEGDRPSRFARLYSDATGLDPYTHAVSDVYQDLFGEASFVGKGIYDVDAFSRSVGTRFPNDLILSHDLLEGSYARAGLVSDIELIEQQPDRFSVDVRRRHRWTRGDWQIVQWLLPIVPGPRRRGLRNTLKAHHRWKILDNLRRGVVSLAMLALLLRGWWHGAGAAYWCLLVVAFLLGPPMLIASAQVLRNLWQRVPPRRWRNTWRGIRDELLRDLFAIAILPFEAWLNLDAIARSAWRLLFSRKHLLEWTPMTDAMRGSASSPAGYLRLMWVAPAVALASGAALWMHAPDALTAALPFLVLWLASPTLAWRISRIPERPSLPLDAAQLVFLQGVARRVWHWFESFVTAEENWLPPDNCQEFPVEQVAHRTSPTNIGMLLLANLAAHDFGYLTTGALLRRSAATLDTLQRLPRYRGHFFNWYDTGSLEPLEPRYVSSVDSGNLMGCLLLLANALEHGHDERLVPQQLGRGLRATVRVVGELLPGVDAADPHANLALSATLTELDNLLTDAIGNRDALPVLHGLLARIETEAEKLARLVADNAVEGEFAEWSGVLARQAMAACEELDELAPWLALGDSGSDDDTARALLAELEGNPPQQRALALLDTLCMRLASPPAGAPATPDLVEALGELRLTLHRRLDDAAALAARCRELAQMDLSFLWDRRREQFCIGYDVARDKRDSGRYDLLASEARILSYVAIAQGQVPSSHWFQLGRQLTIAAGRPALVSWSGSMFEYLMPQLVMPTFRNTLIEDTCHTAVARQIQYGAQQQVPWGVSESAYNATDANLVYQYRAFGVPGLGLKRGLGEDLVVAPYATVMALMVDPAAACNNLERLAAFGNLTRYGFYEALDFTAGRVSEGEDFARVRSWMAHHHGMSLLALSSVLNRQPMQRRFLREPMFRAYALLLREKIPESRPRHPARLDIEQPRQTRARIPPTREATRMDTPLPQVHLLSNGNYHVMLTQTGAGYSRWRDLAVTRWRADATRDDDGQCVYLRDVDSGAAWSATHLPLGDPDGTCSATFSQARAEFHRLDHGIATEVLVAVSAEDDLELRRLRLTNRGSRPRTLEVTSYAEIVLAPPDADASHPVFSKLFLETEAAPEVDALLARRRARSPDDNVPWLLHQMTTRGGTLGEGGFETSREAFLGRQRGPDDPRALAAALEGHSGAVLDPIVSLRRRIRILPGHTAGVDILTGIATDRDAALALARKYHERHLHQRVFQLAWTHEQVVLQQLNMSAGDAARCERIAAVLLYGPTAGAPADDGPLPTQPALWKHGISGDLPVVLVRIANSSQIDLVRQLIQAHGYWQMRGLHVDLLIWNEERSGYRQELQEHILYLIESSAEARGGQGPGRMFAWRIEHLAAPDRALMLAIARCVFSGDAGRLRDQVERMLPDNTTLPEPERLPSRKPHKGSYALQPPSEDLRLVNGRGGFRNDGSEYVVWLEAGDTTPAPWCNVLANEAVGCVVSESGGACTWAVNAHEYRLTPWYNDPLRDTSGEALWLRDEASGDCWSPTPRGARDDQPYRICHGFGYSRFEHVHADLYSEVTTFVARNAPVRLTLLKLVNKGERPRSVSITSFVEWVLGERRERSARHVCTRHDADRGATFAVNSFGDTFADRVAFHALDGHDVQCSADRRAFLGRNRTGLPLGMRAKSLDGAAGAGLDPCSALRAVHELAPGEELETVIVLGAAEGDAAALALVETWRHVPTARDELAAVCTHWRHLLSQLHVRTPDDACDILANGWLAYQVIASRILARSGYYQSGGAWGFRDQLQDAMALLSLHPALARAQLLRAARHQFREGDVQHWWHPPSGKGVRTRISDDLLWLPWCTAEYVRVTGDAAVLDECVPFLEGRSLAADEESVYEEARVTGESASLYEHCLRAIRHSLRFGAHGLPLIGGGDWNDGMNRLGLAGRGESVWLGMFLREVLRRFAEVATSRGEGATATQLEASATELAAMLERHAWDGGWYRRAWNDDGAVIGSATSEECRIDSLPQSWSVLTGLGTPSRRTRALDAVLEHLVDADARVAKLFTPPFDKAPLDPGYIRGYVPGVRENGGQYTHAAVWVAMALARQGRAADAWRLAGMLNPVNHTRDPAALARYRLEPYVMAADVYTARGHVGRGGWSWYTGSAGWMYRLLTESLLGLHREGTRLRIAPCVPDDWQRWSATWRHQASAFHLEFTRAAPGNDVLDIGVDGVLQEGASIDLVDDGRAHEVLVRVGTLSASDPGAMRDAGTQPDVSRSDAP